MATPAESSSTLPSGLFRSFGLRGRRLLRGGTYAEMDVANAMSSSNPLEHWTQAYLRFTLSQGGTRIREVMSGIMTTTGVVAALISTLVVAALVAPPLCTGSRRSDCSDSYGLFATYGAIHIVNLIFCLTTITYATIGSLWLGVHRDEEMSYFIVEYYVFAIAVPATAMSFAIVGTLAAELVRVWIIYGEIAFFIAIGFSFIIMVPCCWFATKIVFTSVELRKAHMAYLMRRKDGTNDVTVESSMMM
eukprot:m.235680 g.235680  ORF g.235680 m.235680 type:complete len:247 (+) comp20202_c0_seq1:102-842(+)